MRGLAAALGTLLWLSGCGAAQPKRAPAPPAAAPAAAVVREAKAQIGRPYRSGGRDPRTGFDCSGLTYYVFKQHGSVLPRSARAQFKVGVEVPRGSLKPGDLVFFDTGGPKPAHVGIYVGRGRFVHAPSTGGRVREDELINNYWRRTWMGARRIE